MKLMFTRKLALPKRPTESFFLWGPRQSGKSTLLRKTYPGALLIDLLKAEEYRRYMVNPEWLRTEQLGDRKGAGSHQPMVIIDEIQKVPALLDEVHWLIENCGLHFTLCGSSARKIKRGHANLLGGRAVRYELHGLVSAELGKDFELVKILNHGYLPRHYLSESPARLLNAYVSDYLKEEIAAEALVRNVAGFSKFLAMAALSDTELVNFSTIARDCGVSSHTVQAHFGILEDTLIGRWLPAYTKRPKRRVIGAPKFYFFDVGVVNHLAKRGEIQPGSELFGKAFENWVFHELAAYNAYSETFAELSYWRLASGIEVDFVINDFQVCIEAKARPKIQTDDLKGLRHLKEDHPSLGRRILVCLEAKRRKTDDGIEIFPFLDFAQSLWRGDLF